jgi:hypothetical protein
MLGDPEARRLGASRLRAGETRKPGCLEPRRLGGREARQPGDWETCEALAQCELDSGVPRSC